MVIFPKDPISQQANSEKLDQFGLFNIVDSLSGGNVLKWEEVLKLENSTVLFKMAMMAQKAQYEHRYNEIAKRKINGSTVSK